jgi:putative flippase GtrA
MIDRILSHTFTKYCFIGVVNGIVTYSLMFTLVMDLNVNYMVGNFIGYAAGIITSFFLNKYTNFKSNGEIKTELPVFIISCLVAYCANLGVLYAMVELLNQTKLTALIIASGVYCVIVYSSARFLVFKRSETI